MSRELHKKVGTKIDKHTLLLGSATSATSLIEIGLSTCHVVAVGIKRPLSSGDEVAGDSAQR